MIAKGGCFVCFLTKHYVLSHIDLYLRPRKEVPGIPYHGLNILKSIPYALKEIGKFTKIQPQSENFASPKP